MMPEPQKRESPLRQMLFTTIVLALLVGSGVGGFLQFFKHYNDGILYGERLNQMQEVTEQLFSGLEDVVESQWRDARYQCNILADSQPHTVDEMMAMMQHQAVLNEMDESSTDLIAVDSRGRYYTQTSKMGLLADMSYFDDQPEQVSFVFNEMTTTRTQMLFLYRLHEPLSLQDGEQEVKILYYGLARDMEELNPYFDCKAYNGNNSTYVVDNQGLKLFSGSSSSSSKDLLEGFNIFTILENMSYLHDSSFAEAKKELDANGLSYSNAILDGQEYYYALYQMENAEWILLFLVPSNYVATNTVALVNTTTRLFLGFAIVMVVICAMMIYWILRRQQQQTLRTAEKNNAALAAANDELEKSNTALLKAQNAATEALQAAETASKAKTDFLSNMSHDIRTPMNAIVGLTSLMENDLHDTEKVQEYLTKLKASSNHLLNLINEILDMNKIEAGKATLHSEPFKMADQVAQIEDVIRPQAKAKGQHFTIRARNVRHENLEGDATRLQQILLNILSNAVKYTDNGGHIELDIEEVPRDGHYARYKFTITDNGIGMSEEFQKHIYESFVRAENSVTNRVQGTGLGMAITKSIVDMMGGAISLESELGKGSRFEVMLEFKIDAEADKAVQTSSLLFLRCPDAEFERIQATTENSPVKVYRTSSPEETMQLLQKNHYDVIFMPQRIYGDGLKAAVKKVRLLAGEDTILLSIAPMPRDEAMDAISDSGLDGFITLPFFLSNMETEVARVKERRNSDAQQEDKSVLVGMNFLCAEDNEINSEILQAMLEVQGASCTICHNGAEIVERFKTVKPGEFDAILMDVQMPIMDGHEATRAIRNGENPLGKNIPIIAMTANAFSEDVQQSYDAGMDAHLSKPINMDVLEKTLRQFRRTPPPK